VIPDKVVVGDERRLTMARDTAGGQQRKQPRRNEDAETEEGQAAEATEEVKDRQEKLADDVDSMLDEIDEVLEENAEDFVRSFVQKGGE
jgi:prokaryotic ubiquitin-like protein Pup